jgi:hypothetical protein
MTLTLSGHQYRALSPSLFHCLSLPVAIGYNGQGWLIFIRGTWSARQFHSRQEAADLIAEAFDVAQREYLG